MALADNASTAAHKFANLPIARQIGLLLGIAASIAIAISVVLWSRAPDMLPLFTQLSARDSGDVVDVLQRYSIPFQLDAAHNSILVSQEDAPMARMKLAQEGLPRENNASFELMENSSAFGSSQLVENARYKQALEADLARTIAQFHAVKSARVHLALPRESAFVRDNHEPSASVFIDVYSGYELKKQTISSIINLVASSIPSLSANRVTVVDQDGQLLNEGAGQNMFTNTDRFFDYRQSLEHQYSQKIQDMLTPILGFGRVKAKVSADIDFTSFEETQENFNPNDPSIRSEQKTEEKHEGGSSASGVPGALSNKAPQSGSPSTSKGAEGSAEKPQDLKVQSTKNFELDKTISHTQKQPGTIKRLSVAVLVDNHQVYNEKTKKMESKALTPDEIKKITTLVSDAIGLNTKRGDSLNVINSDFFKPEPMEALPQEKIWQKAWFWSVLKQAGSAIVILLILFGLLKPLFKNLSGTSKAALAAAEEEMINQVPQGQLNLSNANDFDTQMTLLRQIVEKEPKRVAQVVKTWVDKG